MTYDVARNVHSIAEFIRYHMGAKSITPAEVFDRDGPVDMIQCTKPGDLHIWITRDAEHGSGTATAFYVIECRDGKRRRLTVELAMRDGMNKSFRLHEYNVHSHDDWVAVVRAFAGWIESKPDYEIQ